MFSRFLQRATQWLRPQPQQKRDEAHLPAAPSAGEIMRVEHVPRMRFVGLSSGRVAKLSAAMDVQPPGAQPRLFELRNVLALPGRSGLYTPAGEPVRESCHLFVAEDITLSTTAAAKYDKQRQRHSPPRPDNFEIYVRDAEDVRDSALFLGNFGGHYGHFITDHTARLWAHFSQPDALKRFYLPMAGAQDAGMLPHVAALAAAVGLAPHDLRTQRRARRFRHIIVPEPAFQNGHRIFHGADRAHLATAERLIAQGRRFDAPVYLSRRRLSGGIHDVAGEDKIEALFEARGFTVLHPETMALADQIALFNSAPMIAGTVGSAFHTAMFSLPDWRGTLLVLAGDEPVNIRFALQTAIKSYEAIYIAAGHFAVRSETQRAVLHPDVPAIAAHLKALGI